jgi:hypothetical protein
LGLEARGKINVKQYHLAAQEFAFAGEMLLPDYLSNVRIRAVRGTTFFMRSCIAWSNKWLMGVNINDLRLEVAQH